MNNLLGTIKLTGAIILIDLLLLLIVFAVVPETIGDASWMEGSLIMVGYRVASGQPLCLFGLLWLFKQRLDTLSPIVLMLLSFISSIISIYVIGLEIAILTGHSVIEAFKKANGVVTLFFEIPPSVGNPFFLVILLLVSPWIVKIVHVVWKTRVGASHV